jgi:methionine-rich copper-binding protein CopC
MLRVTPSTVFAARSRRKLATALLPALLAGLWFSLAGQGAGAHAYAQTSVPAPDALLSRAPDAICVGFTTLVDLPLSRIVLSAEGAAELSTGPLRASAKQLCAPVSASLPPGVYRVQWTVVGRDGHRTNGTYRFTVTAAE